MKGFLTGAETACRAVGFHWLDWEASISESASNEFAPVQKSKSRISAVGFVGMAGMSKSNSTSSLTRSVISAGVCGNPISVDNSAALVCGIAACAPGLGG